LPQGAYALRDVMSGRQAQRHGASSTVVGAPYHIIAWPSGQRPHQVRGHPWDLSTSYYYKRFLL